MLLAPAATPEPVAALIEREVAQRAAIARSARAVSSGERGVVASSGVEAKARLESDTGLWAKVIKATGMRVD